MRVAHDGRTRVLNRVLGHLVRRLVRQNTSVRVGVGAVRVGTATAALLVDRVVARTFALVTVTGHVLISAFLIAVGAAVSVVVFEPLVSTVPRHIRLRAGSQGRLALS